MGTHVGAIGFPREREFAGALHELLMKAAHLGATPDGRVDVYVFQDASGSRSTVTLEDRRVACFNPGFVPGTKLEVRVNDLAEDDCPYERPLLVEVLDEHGEMNYPLAVTIEDLGLTASAIAPGSHATLEVVGLGERFDVYPDEEAYRASGTPMAVASLIPSGLFAPGADRSDAFPIRSTVLMSGRVRAAETRTHRLFGQPFVTVVVASYGGDYVVCLDVGDLGGAAATEVPAVGSVIAGQFFLSGRFAPGPS